jgi:hypothetical protein
MKHFNNPLPNQRTFGSTQYFQPDLRHYWARSSTDPGCFIRIVETTAVPFRQPKAALRTSNQKHDILPCRVLSLLSLFCNKPQPKVSNLLRLGHTRVTFARYYSKLKILPISPACPIESKAGKRRCSRERKRQVIHDLVWKP